VNGLDLTRASGIAAERRGERTLMTIIASLLLPFALLQADAPAPGGDRFSRCLALIEDDAERAYEEGMAWAAEAQSLNGYRCAAMALLAQNRFDEGARRLESLAAAVNPAQTALRAELFSQAGNAWLLAREPARARSAFTRGIATLQSDPSQLPDLLIDRARAYAMERDWRPAEEDLSRALDLRPNDPLALRLRAAARMHQNSFDLAEADALAAARAEPDNVDNYLVLGHVRESIRTGRPVEEQ
jgi:tetratricopeptide (TPR) repeat protein